MANIIDEKGKIFGKVNIIDFLVILFLCLILPASYFGIRKLVIKPKQPDIVMAMPKEFREVEIDCRFIKLKPEEVKLIKVGMQEVVDGEIIGEVLQVRKPEPYVSYKYRYNIGQGEIYKKEKGLLQLPARLRLKAEVKGNKLYYKDMVIAVDYGLAFSADNHNWQLITEEERVRLKVKYFQVLPELAELIKVGDAYTETVGETVKVRAKILKIDSITDHKVANLHEGGETLRIVGNPQKKEIVLEIEALCAHRPDGLFFRGKPLQIGRTFEFETDSYYLHERYAGIIIEIIDNE